MSSPGFLLGTALVSVVMFTASGTADAGPAAPRLAPGWAPIAFGASNPSDGSFLVGQAPFLASTDRDRLRLPFIVSGAAFEAAAVNRLDRQRPDLRLSWDFPTLEAVGRSTWVDAALDPTGPTTEVSAQAAPVTPVSEPSSIVLAAAGLAIVGFVASKRRRDAGR